MTIEQARAASFADLAKDIRANIQRDKQVSAQSLDEDLLLKLLIILEEKIGGRRPQLPPPPAKPYSADYDRLPLPKPTKAQQQNKKALEREIRAAERAFTTQDQAHLKTANAQLVDLRRQLADVMFKIRISGLPSYARRNWSANRDSFREHQAKLAAYRAQMLQYEKDTTGIREAMQEWDSLYGANSDYETQLRIVDHLRTDVESYIRGDFEVPLTKLSWRFLPPGPAGTAQLANEIRALKRRYPDLKYDEKRVDFAMSLGPTHRYVGIDEFEGYFAFVFNQTDHVLLENPQEGNAAYIFKHNWASLSKLPKFELLSYFSQAVERVIHREDANWKWRIKRALSLK